MNKIKREKRAFEAYLEDLKKRFENNPDDVLQDGTPLSHELHHVESHISDLDFVIRMKDNET